MARRSVGVKVTMVVGPVLVAVRCPDWRMVLKLPEKQAVMMSIICLMAVLRMGFMVCRLPFLMVVMPVGEIMVESAVVFARMRVRCGLEYVRVPFSCATFSSMATLRVRVYEQVSVCKVE